MAFELLLQRYVSSCLYVISNGCHVWVVCSRQIHSRKMNVRPDVNFEELARSTDDFNGAQLKAVCIEAGMLALRRDATEVCHFLSLFSLEFHLVVKSSLLLLVQLPRDN